MRKINYMNKRFNELKEDKVTNDIGYIEKNVININRGSIL